MFGKLKNKLKEWTKKVSEVDETEEEVQEEIIEEKPEKEEKSKKDLKKEKREEKKKEKEEKRDKKKEEKEKKKGKEKEKSKEEEKPADEELKEEGEKEAPKEKESITEEIQEEIKKETPKEEKESIAEETKEEDKPKEKKSKKLFSKKKTISEEEFNEYSEDLEMILLENNVALEVAEKIIEELKVKITNQELSKKEIEEKISEGLKEIIENVLVEPFDLLKEIEEKKEPYVILFCGINGTGKTTHIAKVANMLKEKGMTSVLAAGDTFRAAAVEQIKKHGEKLDIKVIAQDYNSDPAAVGFDAKKYAEKNKIDVVLIDTAGRIHTATNLIKEMEKIKRVVKPDRTIFVGESITGNDATDQVKAFNDNIGIDGIILSKADIDEKGGTALSVGYTTKKPILFLGTGQNYKDIEPFDKKKFIEKLEL